MHLLNDKLNFELVRQLIIAVISSQREEEKLTEFINDRIKTRQHRVVLRRPSIQQLYIKVARSRTSTREIPRLSRKAKELSAARTRLKRGPHRFKYVCAEVIFKDLILLISLKYIFKFCCAIPSSLKSFQRPRLGR